MNFLDRFKAGFDIGVKAYLSNRKTKSMEKDVYKAAAKWEKKIEKERKKAEKEVEKEAKKLK